jgi:hypothetical protein
MARVKSLELCQCAVQRLQIDVVILVGREKQLGRDRVEGYSIFAAPALLPSSSADVVRE